MMEASEETESSGKSNALVPVPAQDTGICSRCRRVQQNNKLSKTGCDVLLHITASHGHQHCLMYVLDNGNSKAQINSRDCNGVTALILAARSGHNNCIQILLDYGAHVNLRDIEGNSALIVAASQGRVFTVKYLIENGALVNAINKKCQTALIKATEGNYVTSVSALMERGANISLVDKEGRSALDVALLSNSADCASTLRVATFWNGIFRHCCGFGVDFDVTPVVSNGEYESGDDRKVEPTNQVQ